MHTPHSSESPRSIESTSASFGDVALRMLVDESSAARVPALRVEARRFRRSNSGVVSVLFVLLGLVFFASGALVWNTGRVVSKKAHVQLAADTAAFMASQWNARAMNMIVGTNMLILREASAQAISAQALAAPIWMGIQWALQLVAACSPCPFCPNCIPTVIRFGIELGIFLGDYLPNALIPAGQELFGNNNIAELHQFQNSLMAAIPAVIEAERQNIANYYGVDIRLTMPGVGATGNGPTMGGGLSPPVRPASYGESIPSVILPLAARVFKYDNSWMDTSNNSLRYITLGQGSNAYRYFGGLAAVIAAFVPGTSMFGEHYVLEDHNFLGEKSPSTAAEWAPFQVVALASETGAGPQNFVASGLFDRDVTPGGVISAVATGEVYNGIDGRWLKLDPGQIVTQIINGLTSALSALSPVPVSIPGISLPSVQVGQIRLPYPWRMFTTFGWAWQPRLGRSSATYEDYVPASPGSKGPLVRALEYDPTLRGMIFGVQAGDETVLNSVPIH